MLNRIIKKPEKTISLRKCPPAKILINPNKKPSSRAE